ncbi:hypothetical protein [Thalassotalea profundi]|uniref:Uncharacterized protein n=1 Tax=Thalassotalea profundi TaxID=2036687 RepID=A0ABQ3IVI6_9GAMM|nr:hypothetical protein [Thalassotalea profundi]GHE96028.1 hypothetical protein GCM10011501_27060 [Thalassotalea profundi]
MIFEILEKIDKKYPFDLAIAHCGIRMLNLKQQVNYPHSLQNEVLSNSGISQLLST